MTTLDDFFTGPKDSLHPRVRDWQARLVEPNTSATLEVYRPGTDIGQSQAEMYVQFTKNGIRLPLEEIAWDDDLNAGLIRLGVRSVSPEKEAERFSLGLRAALRKASRQFGDGYFNFVLIELLQDSDLMKYPSVAEVLRHTASGRPYREGNGSGAYTTCRELIADAIGQRAQELTGPLRYSREEAKAILVSTLTRYLDDRFSVSYRRRLGLL